MWLLTIFSIVPMLCVISRFKSAVIAANSRTPIRGIPLCSPNVSLISRIAIQTPLRKSMYEASDEEAPQDKECGGKQDLSYTINRQVYCLWERMNSR
jgi:hypothetical protein